MSTWRIRRRESDMKKSILRSIHFSKGDILKSTLLPLVIAGCALVQARVPVQAAPPKKGVEVSKPDESSAKSPSEIWNGLELRSIGPAIASGRISDISVDPGNHNRYFAAVASGGVWRTTNNATTWTPVFDHEGSYSIGCVAIDPKNPSVVWVGTGENNSQRAV